MIVQGDRIAAAACFLPLSVNPRVSRELGTRHRAALGLTEENDAMAIVVSEETGSHLAGDRRRARARPRRPTRCGRACASLLGAPRRLARHADDTELAGLMASFGLRHLGLKFVSIALAALLWLLVSGEQIVERALRIPLEFTNLPAQLELVGDAPNVVDVRVRGSSGALSRIADGRAGGRARSAVGARRASACFTSPGADVRAPFGVEVVQVTPSQPVDDVRAVGHRRWCPSSPAVEGRACRRVRRAAP